MSLVTNVVRRGGSYYFRTRVPKPLVTLLGRVEVWKSLRTSHILDAKRRASAQAVLTQALWDALQAVMDRQTANAMLKDWMAAEVRDYAALREEMKDALGVIRCAPIGSKIAVTVSGSSLATEAVRPGSGLTLSSASRNFMIANKRSGELKAKRLQDYQKAFAAFEAWCGEDLDLADITTSLAGRFMTDLTSYPARGSVRPVYRDLDFKGRVALSLEREEAGTLEPTTINNKYLQPLSAMFDHYRRSGYGDALPTNPFSGIAAKQSRKVHRDNRKRDFTVPELQRLFDLPLFTGSAALKHQRLYQPGPLRVADWRYWILPICAFSGMRLNEACGLNVADLREEEGVAYFLVRDVSVDQSIKSDRAWRRVPLHSALLDLRLVEFVRRQRVAGHERLFPELKPDRFGYLSAVPSKYFNDLIDRIEDPDPEFPGKLTPHSLRHSVIGRMRSAGVRLDVATELVGHEDGSTHAGYGGVEIGALKEAVDKIVYKGLGLSRVCLPAAAIAGEPAFGENRSRG